MFTSWGMETPASYSREKVESILKALENEEKYGFVLRAKGMVPAGDGTWVYFDYVPEESNVREGKPDVTGKFCVIGSKLKEDALKELFTAWFERRQVAQRPAFMSMEQSGMRMNALHGSEWRNG